LSRLSEAEVRAKLVSAAMYNTTPRKLLGYQVILGVFLGILALWVIPLLGGSTILTIGGAALAGLAGWMLPMFVVNKRKQERFDRMDRQMPDMIDLLVVTIEAGLGILASMKVASESLPDPLGQELRLTLQEQRMGLSVGESIESFGKR